MIRGMVEGLGLPAPLFGIDLGEPGGDRTVHAVADREGHAKAFAEKAREEGEEVMKAMIMNNELKGAVQAGDEEIEG